MKQRILEVEGIGGVLVRRHAKARRFWLKVDPHRGILLTMPRYATLGEAKEVVQSKRKWIAKRLLECEAIRRESPFPQWLGGNRTRQHELRMTRGPFDDGKVIVRSGQIRVRVPETWTEEDPGSRQTN